MSSNSEAIERAEIVHEKPVSGEFKEVLFGSDIGNTLWIKFTDRDGIEEWVGKFGVGTSATMRVTRVIEPDQFLVVAGGFAYLVNATTRTLLNHYFAPYVTDIAYDSVRDEFIGGDVFLRIIRDNEQIWRSNRIASDGINHMKIDGRILYGMAVTGLQGEEEPFEFDLDHRSFRLRPHYSPWDGGL